MRHLHLGHHTSRVTLGATSRAILENPRYAGGSGWDESLVQAQVRPCVLQIPVARLGRYRHLAGSSSSWIASRSRKAWATSSVSNCP